MKLFHLLGIRCISKRLVHVFTSTIEGQPILWKNSGLFCRAQCIRLLERRTTCIISIRFMEQIYDKASSGKLRHRCIVSSQLR